MQLRHRQISPSPSPPPNSGLSRQWPAAGQQRRCRRGASNQEAQVQVSGAEKLWKRRRKISNCRWLSAAAALLTLCWATTTLCWASTLTDYDGATFYKAAVGSRVRIACNGSHWDHQDGGDQSAVSLVLWFKGTIERHSVPIYTVDARQRGLSSGARHFVADAYKGRARFVTNATPPYLDLAPLEADDQSEYRCRIDYRAKPRENFLIILFVLVPPKSVHIMDSSGRSLEQIYGPLSEASNLTLLCLSRGGRPAPELTWRRNSKVIDDSYLTLTDFLALRQSRQLLSSRSSSSSSWLEETPKQPMLWQSDNNQQQQQRQRQNSINADPSFAQLEALWREWRNWPEYDFFAKLVGNGNDSFPQPPTADHYDALHIRLNDRKSPESGSSDSPQQQQQQPPAQQQLLTMAVHESITTSANFLKLSSLTGLVQQPLGPEERSGRPVLACHASSLHYDLRTLIRLFAPPSLSSGSGGGGGSQVAHTRGEQVAHLAAPLAQLVEASGRAFEAGLRAAEHLAEQQQQVNSQVQPQQPQPPDAALQQIRLDASSTFGGSNPATNGTHSPASVAAVIYQQLARPHQLLGGSSGGSTSSASTAGELPLPAASSLVASQLIALDIYLRPTNVIISQLNGGQRALSVGQLAEFTCTASGSQPAAKLSWFRNGLPLEQKLWRQINDSPSGNLSRSKLSLKLQQVDHRATLLCRAQNEQLANLQPEAETTVEDSITLTVQYPPKLRLELGNKMLSNAVREGADIFFVCHVDAVPGIKEITWLHNQRPLNETSPHQQSDESGLIISNNSLVLQRVRLEQRGHYACLASNSEGISQSNLLELRVLHAPVCAPTAASLAAGAGGQVVQLVATKALALRASARLLCRMDAEPLDESLEFTWYLNNSHNERRVLFSGKAQQQAGSGDSIDRSPLDSPAQLNNLEGQPGEQTTMPVTATTGSRLAPLNLEQPAKATTSTAQSQLSYSPDSSLDYGRLYCLARNSMGEQKRACVYDILQPDLDELSCLAVNITASSAWIACEWPPSSAASASPARFALELYNSAGTELETSDSTTTTTSTLNEAQLEANLTAGNLREPFFSLNGLRPETGYILQVRPLDSFSGKPLATASQVHFSTRPSLTPGGSPVDEGARFSREPFVEPIDEPHQRHLLSLISTRSTTSQQGDLHLANSNNNNPNQVNTSNRRSFQQQQLLLQSYAARQQVQSSILSRIWSAITSLINDAFTTSASSHRLPASSSGRNQQFMDTSNVPLITAGCLLLLLSLTLTLLLHRYSLTGCSKRRPAKLKKQACELEKRKSGHELIQSTGAGRRDSSSTAADSSQVKNPSSKVVKEQRDSPNDYYQIGGGGGITSAPSPSSQCSNLSSRPRSFYNTESQQSKQSAFLRPASSFVLPEYSVNQPAASSCISKSRSSVCLESNADLIQQQQQQQQRLVQFSVADIDSGRLISDVNLPLVDGSASGNCWPSYATANCGLFEDQRPITSGYATTRHHLVATDSSGGCDDQHELSLLSPAGDLDASSTLLCDANQWPPRPSFAINNCQLIHPQDPQQQQCYAAVRRQSMGEHQLFASDDFATLTRYQPNQRQPNGLTQNMLAYPKQAERNQRMKLLSNGVTNSLSRGQVKRSKLVESGANIIASSSLVSDESGEFSQSHCHWIQPDVSHQTQMIELVPPTDFSERTSESTTCSKTCLSRKIGNRNAANTARPHLSVASPSDGSLDQADPSPSSLTNTTLSQAESLLHHCDSSKLDPQFVSVTDTHQCESDGKFTSILKGSNNSRKATQY